MIITVTMNPALDKIVGIKKFHYGELNRLQHVSMHAGGKGINVSRSIRKLQGKSLVTGFEGGGVGSAIVNELSALGISNDMVRIQENTRVNLKLIDENQIVTELNEMGPKVDETSLLELEKKLLRLVKPNDVVVLSGSVPQNVPTTIYQSFCKKLKEKQVLVVLDADGELLSYGIQAIPTVIKPNLDEFCHYLGISTNCSINQLVKACRKLVETGIELVILSMGEKGALFATDEQVIFADALQVPIVSCVGAGDSMCAVASLALQHHYSLEELIKLSMAASASTVMHDASECGTYELIESLQKQVTMKVFSDE